MVARPHSASRAMIRHPHCSRPAGNWALDTRSRWPSTSLAAANIGMGKGHGQKGSGCLGSDQGGVGHDRWIGTGAKDRARAPRWAQGHGSDAMASRQTRAECSQSMVRDAMVSRRREQSKLPCASGIRQYARGAVGWRLVQAAPPCHRRCALSGCSVYDHGGFVLIGVSVLKVRGAPLRRAACTARITIRRGFSFYFPFRPEHRGSHRPLECATASGRDTRNIYYVMLY